MKHKYRKHNDQISKERTISGENRGMEGIKRKETEQPKKSPTMDYKKGRPRQG